MRITALGLLVLLACGLILLLLLNPSRCKPPKESSGLGEQP